MFDLSERETFCNERSGKKKKKKKKYDIGSKGQFYVAECKTQRRRLLSSMQNLKEEEKKNVLAFHNLSPHAVDLCQ